MSAVDEARDKPSGGSGAVEVEMQDAFTDFYLGKHTILNMYNFYSFSHDRCECIGILYYVTTEWYK